MVKYKKSSNSELKRERFIEICEKYKSDNPVEKTQALEEAINEMEGFIHEIIKKNYSTYKKYYEDLVQEGKIGVMQGMKKYDPTQSLPTTFFKVYIVHEISKFIDTEVNKTTPHYSSNLMKINRIINKFEQEGRAWTPQDIAIETGIKLETIIQCLTIDKYKNEVYYNADDVEIEIKEKGKSPEEQYLENETLTALYTAIAELSPTEKEIIIKKYGLGAEGQMAYKTISEALGIPIEKVKKIRHEAIRKLRESPSIRMAFQSYKKENDTNMVNAGSISMVPEEIANTIMDELAEIDLEEWDME